VTTRVVDSIRSTSSRRRSLPKRKSLKEPDAVAAGSEVLPEEESDVSSLIELRAAVVVRCRVQNEYRQLSKTSLVPDRQF
jgi:hypothetical protein